MSADNVVQLPAAAAQAGLDALDALREAMGDRLGESPRLLVANVLGDTDALDDMREARRSRDAAWRSAWVRLEEAMAAREDVSTRDRTSLLKQLREALAARKVRRPLRTAPGRAVVELDPNRPDRNLAALRGLAPKIEGCYTMGPQLVLMRAGYERPLALTRPLATAELAGAADLVERDADGDLAPARPARDDVQALLDLEVYDGVAPLTGIATQPVLRADGSVVTEPGYDQDTGVYLALPEGYVSPDLPEQVGRDECHAAGGALLDEFATFPFAGEADRGALLALILSMACRDLVVGCVPLFVVTANNRGVGKSKLARAAIKIALAAGVPDRQWPTDEGEQRKRLEALILMGGNPTAALWDNVQGSIGGAPLDGVLTASDGYTARLLGGSVERSVDRVRTVMLMTSNGASYRDDTARRVVQVRLHTDDPRPEDRVFEGEPLDLRIGRLQPELHAHALTLMRGYLQAGRPAVDPARTLGSFEGWSALIRNAVVWAGFADPLDTREGIESDNESTDAHELLIGALRGLQAAGSLPTVFRTRDVVNLAQQTSGAGQAHPDLVDALIALDVWEVGARTAHPKRLGKAITALRERPVSSGHALVRLPRHTGHKGASQWQILLPSGGAP